MANWKFEVKIKHLCTEKEDYDSVQKSMNAIADVLTKERFFYGFHGLSKFHKIPKGNKVFGPVDYANKLMDELYDYADDNRIWIG